MSGSEFVSSDPSGTPDQSIDAKNITGGRWRSEEHQKFLDGLLLYGKDWNKV